MRSEKGGRHISGAERIVSSDVVQKAICGLTERAMTHPNGKPDSISITINAITGAITHIPPLSITEAGTQSPAEARCILEEELTRLELDAAHILELFYSLSGMRGAVLLQRNTLARLEPDAARGLRASCMDYTENTSEAKNHLREALCLASKVAAHPLIVAELCMSDDPNYTTGYFASRERGYIRLTNLKKSGDPHGGRIFIFSGGTDDVAACMEYLEKKPVLVDL